MGLRTSLDKVAAVLLAAIMALAGTAAEADCPQQRLADVTAIVTPSPAIGSYDPFAAGDTTLAMTVTLTSAADQTCSAAVSFVRALSPVMASGAASLSYAIEPGSGGASLVTSSGFVVGSSPPPANRINVTIPANGSASVQIRLRVPAGQVVSAAGYLDPQIQMILVGLNDSGAPESYKSGPIFEPQANVIAKCILPPPAQTSLDLSSAIANGRPNEGVKRSTTFTNVACTAPTRLRLTGAALQPTATTPPRTGFDNFINYFAMGTFGAATSQLTTTTTEQSADSATKNTTSGATANGQIDIDVNLVDGRPIIAGSYVGILKVSIDPTF